MFFANPWGLLGLLAIPTIIGIHLYQRRFPVLLIGGLHLWADKEQVQTAGRRKDRLPLTRSLLLELLAALLMTLVLSQPRFAAINNVTHLVIVLDNSASMLAQVPEEKTFRDKAIEIIKQRVQRHRPNCVVTIVTTGRRPVMLAGPAVPWHDAEQAVNDWQPMAPQHDFRSAWDVAAQFAQQSGQLLFLTDRLPGENVTIPNRMEVISVGQPLNNVAISSARWSFQSADNTGELFVRIHNHGRKDVPVKLTGRTTSQLMIDEQLTVPAGNSVPLVTKVPGGIGMLKIDIDAENDGLQTDNQVTLIEPKVRLISIANTLNAKHPAARLIQKTLEAVPDWQPADVGDAELLIGTAALLPPSRHNLWWLGVGPLATDAGDGKQPKDLLGPYLLEKNHPLLDGVVLGGVVWGGVQPMPYQTTPLVSAGSHVLVGQLNGTQTTGYVINIDMNRSNLSESPDWPILLGNLVRLRRANKPGLRAWNYRLNETIRFRLYEGSRDPAADNPRELTLVHNKQPRSLVRTPIVELPTLDQTGIYDLYDGKRFLDRFAINFYDAEESQLRNLSSGAIRPQSTAQESIFSMDHPYSWLIVIGLLIILTALFADWAVLQPQHITMTTK